MPEPSCTVYDNTLGGSRLRRHIAPQIRTAGLVVPRDCGTVAQLLSDYYLSGSVTPDLIKSHRRGGEVGRTSRHYGRARDPPVDESIRHGLKNDVSETAFLCLQPDTNRLSALMNEQLEHMYLSSVRRPLGHAPVPPYEVVVPRDGFGIPSDPSESVERVMYSGKDVDVLHPVGERKDRGYNWESVGIDPTQHRFGKTFAKDAMTSADVMRENCLVSNVFPKFVKDHRMVGKVELGKPRSYGFDNSTFKATAEKRAVRRSRRGDGDNARALLSSWARHPATLQALEKQGDRAATSEAGLIEGATTTTGDNGGEGSVRRSRFACTFDSKQSGRSVALTELEDEARVPHLLYPCHYVQLGVKSEYFAGGRPLEEIRRLCRKVDFGLNDSQIDEVFASIAQDGLCGIEQFKNKAAAMGYLA
ncbi:flagella associated protein [Trypanosoma rangeli]|uniref:Flagella associated protein n=1 Tax=Trypanosoma rangeli TaxID=5698 RepID=A0A422NVL8_TRYRA|nr:flagella associated protein [Trypanosoma rangeli]RNF09505.1 flagella associated protein [Trypanosoma rangeli]|eukprot:RNF09505.1 flagella associated protein [Trypanosoma rangeli]